MGCVQLPTGELEEDVLEGSLAQGERLGEHGVLLAPPRDAAERGGVGARRNWPHSMGVSVNDSSSDITTAALSVSANSRSIRPTTPPMNITGVKTAISDTEIDRIVKPMSRAPASAA